MTKSQDAIRRITTAMRDTTGNLPPLPGIFPDYEAPIVRTGEDGERELVRARWGMPSPAFALKGRKVDKGGDEHPQHVEPALAAVARASEPVRKLGAARFRCRTGPIGDPI